nr:kinesin-like protein KIF13B [Labrus bergylta]
MPKLLKSLFPARDEKKELRPSPPSQQHVPRIITSGGDDNRVKTDTTAHLRPPTKDRRSEFPEVPPLPVHDPHDITPLSPLSQSSSGYFSSSVSTVTLSDVSNPPRHQDGRRRSLPSTARPITTTSLLKTTSLNTSEEEEEEEEEEEAAGGGFERLEIFVDDEERSQDSALPDWLTDGAYVTVGSNKAGTVRYMGSTQFAEGVWVGVELDTPVGKNDGSVGGHRYFHCKPGYGVLVRPDRVSCRDQTGRRTETSPLQLTSPFARRSHHRPPGGENRKSWSS